jgi:hypothetical protein
MEPLTIRVRGVVGRGLLALDARGLPLHPQRYLGCDGAGMPLPEGEPIAAQRTATGELVPVGYEFRNALACGDLERVAETTEGSA